MERVFVKWTRRGGPGVDGATVTHEHVYERPRPATTTSAAVTPYGLDAGVGRVIDHSEGDAASPTSVREQLRWS